MKKFSFLLLAVVIGFSFFATNSFARVTLDASTAFATVPAERTQRIGVANDGIIPLNDENIGWDLGQAYVSGNRLKLWFTGGTGLEFVNVWRAKGGNTNGAWTAGINADSLDNFNLQLNTLANVASSIMLNGAASTIPELNVAGVTGEQLFNLNGACLTSGMGTVDGADADPILQTVIQYSGAVKGTARTTIDVVNTAGRVFISGSATANAYTFDIESTNVFGGTDWHCPTLANSDVLNLVLEGTNAFQGVSFVEFQAGGTLITRAVPTSAKANVYNKWTTSFTGNGTAALTALCNAAVGNNGIDIDFDITLLSDMSTALEVRKIDVKGELDLQATGNGSVLSVNFPNRIQFVQNGAQYASNMFKVSEAGTKAYFKFANMSTSDIPLEIKYFPNAGKDTTNAATSWITYTGDGGNGVPAGEQIVITTAEAAAVFGFAANTYDGLIIFRAKGSPSNITAMVNCVNANGSFNAPMLQYDPTGNQEWTY